MASTRKKSQILQPLRQSTWPVMRKSFAKYGFSATDILLNWRAIVGDELAQRAVPTGFRGRETPLHYRLLWGQRAKKMAAH